VVAVVEVVEVVEAAAAYTHTFELQPPYQLSTHPLTERVVLIINAEDSCCIIAVVCD
jgi:hypothetical protein